jgi:dienelactone hydrolase
MSRIAAIWIMALLTALGTLAASSTAGRAQATNDPDKTDVINGLKIAVWQPTGTGPFPLVLFSHGLRGCRDQSTYLLRAFAQNGFMVVAADHKDNRCGQQLSVDDILSASQNPSGLSEPALADRRRDMENLRTSVLGDKALSALIDSNKIVLVGHSLGGYTALAVAGAHLGAKMDGVVGAVALAPYTAPLQTGGTIGGLSIPVLFEVGEEDLITRGIAPVVAKMRSPACLVVYRGAGHFAWVDPKHLPAQLAQPQFQSATADAAVAFLKAVVTSQSPKLPDSPLATAESGCK